MKDEARGKLRYLCLISPIKYPVHVEYAPGKSSNFNVKVPKLAKVVW